MVAARMLVVLRHGSNVCRRSARLTLATGFLAAPRTCFKLGILGVLISGKTVMRAGSLIATVSRPSSSLRWAMILFSSST